MLKITNQKIAEHNYCDVIEYTLLAENGFMVKVLNYGGIISAIYAPDKTGKFENIVLAHPEFDPENVPYYGAITGRIAGRIKAGKFNLNGVDYQLAINNGPNHLHGGIKGLDKQIWTVRELSDGIELSYLSHDMEESYPGNLELKVSYRITADFQLKIDYSAKSDCDTILNLTNHSYFDLSAGVNPMAMQLKLVADYFAAVDADGCTTGELINVAGTPFDFNHATPLSEVTAAKHPQVGIVNGGCDHPFVLKQTNIDLIDPNSGRTLSINTSEPCCVVYTSNWHEPQHVAVCLETQRMPNAVNWEQFRDSVILRESEIYSSHNIWTFGVMN